MLWGSLKRTLLIAVFLNSRRLQRESKVVNVWPASPKAPARELYALIHFSIRLIGTLMNNSDRRNAVNLARK